MSLSKEKKLEIVGNYGQSQADTGSTEVQIALLTERINTLSEHLKSNSKDYHGLRGLLIMVGRRKRLLRYYEKSNPQNYQQLVSRLGIRR